MLTPPINRPRQNHTPALDQIHGENTGSNRPSQVGMEPTQRSDTKIPIVEPPAFSLADLDPEERTSLSAMVQSFSQGVKNQVDTAANGLTNVARYLERAIPLSVANTIALAAASIAHASGYSLDQNRTKSLASEHQYVFPHGLKMRDEAPDPKHPAETVRIPDIDNRKLPREFANKPVQYLESLQSKSPADQEAGLLAVMKDGHVVDLNKLPKNEHESRLKALEGVVVDVLVSDANRGANVLSKPAGKAAWPFHSLADPSRSNETALPIVATNERQEISLSILPLTQLVGLGRKSFGRAPDGALSKEGKLDLPQLKKQVQTYTKSIELAKKDAPNLLSRIVDVSLFGKGGSSNHLRVPTALGKNTVPEILRDPNVGTGLDRQTQTGSNVNTAWTALASELAGTSIISSQPPITRAVLQSVTSAFSAAATSSAANSKRGNLSHESMDQQRQEGTPMSTTHRQAMADVRRQVTAGMSTVMGYPAAALSILRAADNARAALDPTGETIPSKALSSVTTGAVILSAVGNGLAHQVSNRVSKADAVMKELEKADDLLEKTTNLAAKVTDVPSHDLAQALQNSGAEEPEIKLFQSIDKTVEALSDPDLFNGENQLGNELKDFVKQLMVKHNGKTRHQSESSAKWLKGQEFAELARVLSKNEGFKNVLQQPEFASMFYRNLASAPATGIKGIHASGASKPPFSGNEEVRDVLHTQWKAGFDRMASTLGDRLANSTDTSEADIENAARALVGRLSQHPYLAQPMKMAVERQSNEHPDRAFLQGQALQTQNVRNSALGRAAHQFSSSLSNQQAVNILNDYGKHISDRDSGLQGAGPNETDKAQIARDVLAQLKLASSSNGHIMHVSALKQIERKLAEYYGLPQTAANDSLDLPILMHRNGLKEDITPQSSTQGLLSHRADHRQTNQDAADIAQSERVLQAVDHVAQTIATNSVLQSDANLINNEEAIAEINNSKSMQATLLSLNDSDSDESNDVYYDARSEHSITMIEADNLSKK